MIISESLFHSHALASKTMAFVIHQRTHNPKPILSLFEKNLQALYVAYGTNTPSLNLWSYHKHTLKMSQTPTIPPPMPFFHCLAFNMKSPRVPDTSFLSDTKKHHPTCRIYWMVVATLWAQQHEHQTLIVLRRICSMRTPAAADYGEGERENKIWDQGRRSQQEQKTKKQQHKRQQKGER
jgi:hypothetical protein